jgi:hypothetical protein
MKRFAFALMFSAGLVVACSSQPKIEDTIPTPLADPNAPPPLILHPSETQAMYASDEALATDIERAEMASDAGVPGAMDGGAPRPGGGDGGVPNRNPSPKPNPNPNPNNPSPNPPANPTPAPTPPAPSTPGHP